MNTKLKSIVLAIGLSVSSYVVAEEVTPSACEAVAELAGTVAKYRDEGMSKQQQMRVADAAMKSGMNLEIVKLHRSMINNCYSNQLSQEEMSVIYYMACKRHINK